MTHLKIIQNNTLADTEEVSQEIIQKLYDLVVSGDLDAEMKGRLHLTAGYRALAEYLHQMFPNLIISIDDYIIPFEDPKMVTYLNSIGVGSNGVITEADAAAATVVANSQNTEVTKFNELKYFTSITESRGGVESSNDGWVKFHQWTALEEVDISNFTSIGHNNSYGYGDIFAGCTSLKKVTASDKLTAIGHAAFNGDSQLEDILNLEGTITVYGYAFQNCTKLKEECFDNVEILFPVQEFNISTNNQFYQTKAITLLTLSSANTYIPDNCFQNSNIKTINIPSGITTFHNNCFKDSKLEIDASYISHAKNYHNSCFVRCNITGTFAPDNNPILLDKYALLGTNISSVDLSSTSLTTIYQGAFSDCKNLTSVTLPQSLTTIDNNVFSGCTALTTIDVGGTTTLGAGVFYNCPALTSVVLPSTLTNLPAQTFRYCTNLSNVNLGNITTFGNESLLGCSSLSQIEFPSGVYIGTNSFASSGITSVRFRGSGTVGTAAFEACNSLTSLVFDGDVNLAIKAFYNCKYLTSVDLSNISESSLFYRGNYDAASQFSGCSRLLQVTLNPNITKLPNTIFSSIDAELYVTIPAGVTDMSNSFYGTHSHLTMLPTTPPTLLGDDPLAHCREIIVPAGTLATYQAASGWSRYSSIMSESTT